MAIAILALALMLESCPGAFSQITQARRYKQDEEDQLLHGQLIRFEVLLRDTLVVFSL